MHRWELEFAVLIPSKKVKDDVEETPEVEPYVGYKGTDYRKTIKLRIPSWQPLNSKLKRFWNWLRFVWCHSRARKCRKLTFLTIFLIFLLLFTIICVLIPLAFKFSTDFQRYMVFNPVVDSHESYSDAIKLQESYDTMTFYKPKNMYVVVDKTFNMSLGLWSMTPYKHDDDSNIVQTAAAKPYLLHFHDFTGDRRSYTKVYSQLLKVFHVIAFDYRSYGDSSQGKLTDTNLVSDSVQLYKWLRQNTNSSIYVWGDRLGGGVAARTVMKLQEAKIEVPGLYLENSYLSADSYLKHNWFIAKVLTYTFWFKQTITNPLKESDLWFYIKDDILEIKCPIMFVTYRSYALYKDIYGDVKYVTDSNFGAQNDRIRVKNDMDYYFEWSSNGNGNILNSIRTFITISNGNGGS